MSGSLNGGSRLYTKANAHLAEVMEPVLRILHDEHHLQLHDIGMPLDGADLNFLELWSQLEVQVYYPKPPVGKTAPFLARVLMLVMKLRWIWGF